MTAKPANILVVANPDDRGEVCAVLANLDLGEVATGNGSDETVADYEALRPDVVVMCANLDQGDAQALVASMRQGAHGSILKVVLIGEVDGPIRNALDAADFGVDRFVSRPLAAKALGFAVRSCVEAAELDRVAEEVKSLVPAEEPVEEESPPEEQPAPPPRAPLFAAVATPPPVPTVDVDRRVDDAVNLAIEDFVSDAINSIGELVAEQPMQHQREANVDDAWTEPPPPKREPTLILSGGGAAPPPDLPPEPQPSPSPAPVHAEVAGTVRESTHPMPAEGEAADPRWSCAADDDLLEDPDDLPVELDHLDLARDLEVDPLEPSSDDLLHMVEAGVPGPEASPVPVADLDRELDPEALATAPTTSTGGMFARELRKKMSQMAERLFPGREAKAGSLDVGVAHGHKTEIDLTAIGVDTEAHLDAAGAPYEDLGTEETFPDVPEPVSSKAGSPEVSSSEGMSVRALPLSDTPIKIAAPDETTARRVAATEAQGRGEINLIENDIASLVARLFGSGFTGRIALRRPPAEKSIHFDKGRPVFATSNLPHDRMGDLLYREGKITRAQHARSRDLVAESGRRMGEILIEMGFLKRRELLPAVRRHIEDIIYSLFSWDAGEYVVSAGEYVVGEKIRLSRHPAAIILEGVRRKYGREMLVRRLGSGTTIIAVGERGKLNPIVAAADLSGPERTAIQSLDGQRNLEEVAEAAGVSLLTVYQLAFGLVILSVAEIVRRGGDDDLDLESVRPPTLVGETDLAIDRQRVLAKFALVDESDYFALLGVRRDASSFEIKRAYEAARRDYAGESFPAEVRGDLDAQITEINQLLDEAYRVLRNERLRATYLANLSE